MMSKQQMIQDTDNGFLLEGTVYVRNRRIVGSNREEVGNTTSLKLKAHSEKKERISRKKGTAGKALDTVTITKPTEISFALDTFNKTTLAMALMGAAATVSEAKTVHDEVVNVVKKGVWLDLANRNIDPTSLVVKNASGAEVKAENIVYNAAMGWVQVASDSKNVNDGEDIKVSYKTKGGGLKVAAETVADYDLEIWVDGFNAASQKNFALHIPSAVVTSNSEVDWLADDFASAEFGGNTVLVDGHQSPYYYEEFEA